MSLSSQGIMKNCLILFVWFFGLALAGMAQEPDSLYWLEGVESNGDTLPHQNLEEIPVFPKLKFKNHRYEKRYYRLERKVKKVYPYATKAAELLDKYEAEYLAAATEKERRKYVKQVEKELFDQYGSELKKLTISEGRILIKLIDRQTGHTSYELIKDLKGGLVAFFWQGVARLFGNDLKEEYDPVIEDLLIEQIILRIEAGVI
ncbi:DUF4294 domain-containing protein [uncultured Sunxiuqinia sp.]|uniref:DUF4294 domain-containing protein n=1 Tax=uncultured Sunxiuqinia sp. TaxID=1573825 RepID=UPI00260C8852|nr:DUF4294 domain-containing protein [uncultured Sunxiuqinia sp.]